MKKIKSTVTYNVPGWTLCNDDRMDISVSLPKPTCRFCQKTRTGHHCALYDVQLMTEEDGAVHKAPQCVKATAGFASIVNEPAAPTVDPKVLMKQTIDMYAKTVDELIKQGYPRPLANQVAKQHILGG